MWVAPIKLETGRYENLSLDERKCFICDAVESKCHVICECPLYEDLRNALFAKAENVVPNFYVLSNFEKKCVHCTLLSHCDIVKVTAKILCDILNLRRSFIFISLTLFYFFFS